MAIKKCDKCGAFTDHNAMGHCVLCEDKHIPENEITSKNPNRTYRRNCKDCEFYSLYKNDGAVGKCRRFPPQVLFIQRDNGKTTEEWARWPSVQQTEWCGEYKERWD